MKLTNVGNQRSQKPRLVSSTLSRHVDFFNQPLHERGNDLSGRSFGPHHERHQSGISADRWLVGLTNIERDHCGHRKWQGNRHRGAFPEVGQPTQPLRQVPVPIAEQRHARRHENRADHGRVNQNRHRQAEAHLLEHDQLSAGKPGEHRHHDQGCTRDDLARCLESHRH